MSQIRRQKNLPLLAVKPVCPGLKTQLHRVRLSASTGVYKRLQEECARFEALMALTVRIIILFEVTARSLTGDVDFLTDLVSSSEYV